MTWRTASIVKKMAIYFLFKVMYIVTAALTTLAAPTAGSVSTTVSSTATINGTSTPAPTAKPGANLTLVIVIPAAVIVGVPILCVVCCGLRAVFCLPKAKANKKGEKTKKMRKVSPKPPRLEDNELEYQPEYTT
ncbi:uncharacterized protein LOC106160682 [Lingula anatina]|uniref:Uncharacterized protein LOC106160682 n=1 Tax=Lingula anatina TaxID=7574 RepID=A0A1S3I5Z8_LINAN|nr:uncharacterized protein LOC106160682 [Lingula anatina]|eukprot:XP_013392799.1 uncharacterized protein LOC106160682 [Lingula anatina]